MNEEIAKIFLKDKHYEQGYKFLNDVDEKIRLAYAKEDPSDKRYKLCEESIKISPKEYLLSYVNILSEKLLKPIKDENEIFQIISNTSNDKILSFGFSLIETKNRKEIIKSYLQKNTKYDLSFILLFKLKNRFIDEQDFEEYFNYLLLEFYQIPLKEQSTYIKSLEKQNYILSNEIKFRVFTLFWFEKNQINPPSDINIEQFANCIISHSNIFKNKQNNIIQLLKIWQKCEILTQQISKEIAIKLFPNNLTKDRKFWSSILNEESEMEILLKTEDVSFGLTSNYQSVIKKSNEMLQNNPELPDNVIDSIIERGDSYLYVNTKIFDSIIKRAKSQYQLQQIYKSLKSNGQNSGLLKFISNYFNIPKQLCFPCDYDKIINIGENLFGITN